MEPGQVILYFIGLIAIIFAAYYVTYFISVKASGQSRGRLRNKNINIIDRFSISRDKSFYLVEIAGKVYVVGITNHGMTLIDTLDAAAFSEAAAEQRDKPEWYGMPGGKITGPLTAKLAAFIAGKTGRTMDPGGDNPGGGTGSNSFAETMKAAGKKNQSGEAERGRNERPTDSEGEE